MERTPINESIEVVGLWSMNSDLKAQVRQLSELSGEYAKGYDALLGAYNTFKTKMQKAVERFNNRGEEPFMFTCEELEMINEKDPS